MNGTDVKEIRDSLGLSREQFARKLGVSFFSVWRWEKGVRKPSPLAERALRQIVENGEGKVQDSDKDKETT